MPKRGRKIPLDKTSGRRSAGGRGITAPAPPVAPAASDVIACYVNADYLLSGQAAAFVLKRTRSSMTMAAFLIDVWCAGLKDAWGSTSVTREEFDHAVANFGKQMHGKMRPVEFEQVVKLVAGGIRFASRNGFQLPPHCRRWIRLLGKIGSTARADLRGFGVGDGRLRWIGSLAELRDRLADGRAAQFLSRGDVEYVLNPDDEDDLETIDAEERDDAQLGALPEAMAQVLDRCGDGVRQWCVGRGMIPSELIGPAIQMLCAEMIFDLAQIAQNAKRRRKPTKRKSGRGVDPLNDIDPDTRAELELAKFQVQDFAAQYGGVSGMIEAYTATSAGD